jgi:hypothetical protein
MNASAEPQLSNVALPPQVIVECISLLCRDEKEQHFMSRHEN